MTAMTASISDFPVDSTAMETAMSIGMKREIAGQNGLWLGLTVITR
ncbi:MAG TPA: hypothetical protein QF703_02540 [Candidatus Thalassarchaeaceae archaeon]|nr:hypothetical protein [Candidatus Thalassarchaeaceae archaeon]